MTSRPRRKLETQTFTNKPTTGHIMTPVYLPPISLGGGTFRIKIIFKLNTIYAASTSINIPNKLD